MPEIAGYSDIQVIYEGNKSRVFKAVDDSDGSIVALKATAGRLTTAHDAARLHKERGYLERLDLKSVPTVRALLETGASLVLVMEYFDQPSLKTLLDDGPLPVSEAIEAFAGLAAILGSVHRRGIIHKDLSPGNILMDKATGRVRLVDFDSAMDIPRHAATGVEPKAIEGTYAYMSPEQTGRMNRRLDHRTDFYSLGACLYEALTGRRPFSGEDLTELVHCHLAVTPQPPHALDPNIPKALSAVVMKCLAKDASDRYQSAKGLADDLQRCREALKDGVDTPGFEPGGTDLSDRFSIPDGIFGRKESLELLNGLYAKAKAGRSGIAIVSGYSGVGKTSLVRELSRTVAAEQGYAAYGKFDQYSRHAPYTALVEAFSGVVRQLLSESPDRMALWKKRIVGAVGINGRVLTGVLPELEHLIGEQPPVATLEPVEARTRFATVFANFIEAFDDPAHPLVLFLDDLQWIDDASLSLLELFASTADKSAILLAGAYRSNEVSDSHPLATALKQMRDQGARMTEIALEPLSDRALREFLCAMFGRGEAEVAELCAVVSQKTGGNPLFFRTMLTTLHEAGHIAYDYDALAWNWDMDAIRSAPYADNVVDALRSRISILPKDTAALLTLGAYVGNPFGLDALTRLSDTTRREAAARLVPALEQGLILCTATGFELYSQAPAEGLDGISFRFAHDRIQQAAYALLEEEDKPAMHLETGRMLMGLPEAEHTPTHLFDVAGHMAQAAGLLTDADERLAVARLVLEAGRKAKVSTAFADSAGLLRFGASLLPEDAWDAHYDLACAVHLELAEASYLCAAYDEAESLYETIAAKVTRDDDLLRLYNIQAKQFHHQARFAEAVDVEYRGLALLGHDLPREDDALFGLFGAEQERIAALLAETPPADFFDKPENTDPRFTLTLEILFDLFADAYLLGRAPILAAVSALMARLSMENGNNPMASVSYINYASTVCAIGADYPTGIELGGLAVRLAEKYRQPALQNYTYHVYSLAVCHWRHPLPVSQSYWRDASKLALASGSPYAGYVFLQLAHVQLAMGRSLDELEEQIAISRDFLQSSGMDAIVMLLKLIAIQPVEHLRGRTKSLETLDDGEFDTDAFLEENKELAFFTGSLVYSRLRVACLGGETPSLDSLVDDMALIDATQQGQVILADSIFYLVQLLIRGLDGAGEEDAPKWREHIGAGMARMENWAGLCAANFGHKLTLLKAELARIDRDTDTAMDLYDEAVDLALGQQHLLDAGLAAWRGGQFWIGRGKPHMARVYIEKAYTFFERFGATGVTERLLADHPDLLQHVDQKDAPFTAVTTMHHSVSSSRGTREFSERIDMGSVVKASQAISRHMNMNRLSRELTALAVENAGATKGVLLLGAGETFTVAGVALGQANGSDHKAAIGKSAEDSGEASPAVVNYVIRTGSDVVVDNALKDERFGQCPHIRTNRPASICCLPIRQRGGLRGLLYLENTKSAGAFRVERVETLRILAAQATISLENARAYDELEDLNRDLEIKVAERTRELNDKNVELERLSTTDLLTGIANRRHLEDQLLKAIDMSRRYGKGLSVILFDVDHFKRVNDTYGHTVGDAVLSRVAAATAEAIRKTDVLGRWGGEEFLIIVPESGDDASNLAGKLRDALEEVDHPEAGTVTASLGVARYRDGDTATSLVGRADEALYRAKEGGRNRVEIAE